HGFLPRVADIAPFDVKAEGRSFRRQRHRSPLLVSCCPHARHDERDGSRREASPPKQTLLSIPCQQLHKRSHVRIKRTLKPGYVLLSSSRDRRTRLAEPRCTARGWTSSAGGPAHRG